LSGVIVGSPPAMRFCRPLISTASVTPNFEADEALFETCVLRFHDTLFDERQQTRDGGFGILV
jgi:hypothetical protein